MQRRDFTVALMAAGVSAGLASAPARAALSDGDASMGVRTALERGASAAVGLLGKSGGFDDPKVRIPLPGALDSVAKLAAVTGQQARVDELVNAMNRAAEAAVPEAKKLLLDSGTAATAARFMVSTSSSAYLPMPTPRISFSYFLSDSGSGILTALLPKKPSVLPSTSTAVPEPFSSAAFRPATAS